MTCWWRNKYAGKGAVCVVMRGADLLIEVRVSSLGLCLATQILGDSEAVEFIPLSWAQRFPALQSGDVDVIIKLTEWTMSRDLELNLQYSRPYFLGGTQFATKRALGITSATELEGATICGEAGTSTVRHAVQGITSGFNFLERGTGWDMGFAFLPVSISDPYWYTLLMGFMNTVIVGYVAMIFATVLGVGLAGMRISGNPVLNMVALVYVDLIRNIPPILQVLAWYAAFSAFPGPRQAIQLGDSVSLSARGIYLPALNVTGFAVAAIAATVVIAAGALLWIGMSKRFMFTDKARKAKLFGGVVLCAFALICVLCFAFRIPDTDLWSIPALEGFNFRGGMSLTPELMTILMATMVYGSAYVAEIVRGGFLSVDQGKVEAGRALGLSGWMIFTKIRLPITVQNILPMMTNLYVWLIKATTLGIAVGFSDMFAVTISSINQSGQTIEFILISAASFWILNNGLVWLLNGVGARMLRRQKR